MSGYTWHMGIYEYTGTDSDYGFKSILIYYP